MAESSLRAARSPLKGGVPNVLFGIAAAERPPAELCGRAAEVSILFPWGSLLRGALALDAEAAAGIAALVAPGGRVEALASVADRDAATVGIKPLAEADATEIARRWREHGLELTEFRPATAAEAMASGSTWAKRLGGGAGRADGGDRAVWRIGLRCIRALDVTDLEPPDRARRLGLPQPADRRRAARRDVEERCSGGASHATCATVSA
jgi:hypothetical protein